MRIVLQIGYARAGGYRKEGQILSAWINDVACTMDSDVGMYITSLVEKQKGYCWFLWSGDATSEDSIRVECKTAMRGAGTVEDRTFETLYYVDENAPVRGIIIPKVGMSGYPLIKGKVLELGSVSERDKRESELDQFLDKDRF